LSDCIFSIYFRYIPSIVKGQTHEIFLQSPDNFVLLDSNICLATSFTGESISGVVCHRPTAI
jgi:hypothetical protein